MTEDERREAMIAGWNACRKSLYAVCEDVMDTEGATPEGFHAGMRRAAKSIARGFGAMEAEDDDNFTAAVADTSSEKCRQCDAPYVDVDGLCAGCAAYREHTA